jgi:Cu/Ag efflux protein CusF
MQPRKFAAAFVIAALIAGSAQAAGETAKPATGAAAHDAHHPESAAAGTFSTGEVKQVDKTAGKVTIKHGPLTNLDMPAMTMVFRVKDPAMLDQVKTGDNIRFIAEKMNGALTVTRLEAAK